jgi:PGF-CTERM protein
MAASLAGIGTGLATSRTRRQAGGFGPLGSVDVSGARETVVHHDGEIAYVGAGDGVVAVDVATPAEPTVLAERRDIDTGGGQQLQAAWDVWAWEDRLVLTGPALPPGGAHGFALFDITDPSTPEQVAWYETDFYIHNGFLDDGRVYLTGSGTLRAPLVIVDIADDEPRELGRFSPLEYEPEWDEIAVSSRVLHDAFVQNGIAYLPYWDAGTWIVDVSDPENAEVLARIGDYTLSDLQSLSGVEASYEARIPPGNAHNATVNDDGTLLAVGTESWAREDPENAGEMVGGPGGIDLWDISQTTSPTHLSHIDSPETYDGTTGGWFTTAHNCDIVGDRLYSSWYYGGVKVHDISDPANPEERAWWRDPTQACFWAARGASPGEFFVGGSVNLETDFTVPNPTTERLYTFPDREGTQADPPDLLAGPNGSAGQDSKSTVEQTQTPVGQTPTPAASTPTAERIATQNESQTSADDGGPGFGVGGAMAGVGGLAYVLSRRSRKQDTDE